MRTPRLLVFSPCPERSGASIALLREMRWLTKRNEIDPIFVFRRSGDLLGAFNEMGRTVILDQRVENLGRRVAQAVQFGDQFQSALQKLLMTWLICRCRLWHIDGVYVNTVLGYDFVRAASKLGLPTVWRVHESNHFVAQHVSSAHMREVVQLASHFAVVSRSVAEMLITYGASSARISIVPGAVNEQLPLDLVRRSLHIRSEFGVPNHGSLVVGAGIPSPTKGTDLFVQLAICLRKHDLGIRLCWIGLIDHPDSRQIRFDIATAKLQESVRLVNAVPDPLPYLAAADVFASTSREDSMPISMLEAAAIGVPTVCFANSGGSAELCEAGGAISVDFLDVPAMAQCLMEVLHSLPLRFELSQRAHTYVEQHCLLSVVGPAMSSIIRRTIPIERF